MNRDQKEGAFFRDLLYLLVMWLLFAAAFVWDGRDEVKAYIERSTHARAH